MFLTNSVGFSQNPTYIDPSGDQGGDPSMIDMREIWIANNETHIMFKVNFSDVWNQNGYAVYACISIDGNATGSSTFLAEPVDFLVNYVIGFYADSPLVSLYEILNSSNDLSSALQGGLAFYSFSNGNRTLEFGYKLHSYYLGKGYLNLSLEQTIQIKLVTGGDTDIAPNIGLAPLNYTLVPPENPNGGIPGFELGFLSFSLTCAVIFIIGRKKQVSF